METPSPNMVVQVEIKPSKDSIRSDHFLVKAKTPASTLKDLLVDNQTMISETTGIGTFKGPAMLKPNLHEAGQRLTISIGDITVEDVAPYLSYYALVVAQE